MENQQQQRNQQQRIQQLEDVARHYTQAASALRNQNEQECDQHIQQAQQAATQIRQQAATTTK